MDPNFGLSVSDEWTLVENCHIVFHSAATVRFHEPLRYERRSASVDSKSQSVSRLAIQMNVASVKKLLALCHKMKKLQVKIELKYFHGSSQLMSSLLFTFPRPMRTATVRTWRK